MNRIRSMKFFHLILIILSIIFHYRIIPSSAHQETPSSSLDTGSNMGSISWVFVIAGGLIFVLILISAFWLLKKAQRDTIEPQTYMEKIELFGKNARLYILHIQGMSLTYGVFLS